MKKRELAKRLRQRQHSKGLVAVEIIDGLPDDAIIASYITCSCCGAVQATPQQLSLAIECAHDVGAFFQICDALAVASQSAAHTLASGACGRPSV